MFLWHASQTDTDFVGDETHGDFGGEDAAIKHAVELISTLPGGAFNGGQHHKQHRSNHQRFQS